MKEAINWAGVVLIAAVMADFMVVLFTVLQIGNGVPTQHIAFWDEQVRFIMIIMK